MVVTDPYIGACLEIKQMNIKIQLVGQEVKGLNNEMDRLNLRRRLVVGYTGAIRAGP